MKPRDYQINFVNGIVKEIAGGYKRILGQLATGAGKTVCFSYLLQRYFNRYPSHRVCIVVHRGELQVQTEKTLKNFGITNVPVLMVETFNNLLKKQGHVHYDLIIMDEAHIGNHKKIISHYRDYETILIGFSATPISSSKKTPLLGDYQTIVTGVDINDLIEMGHLCPAIHHATEIKPDKVKVTGGDYNMQAMGVEFSKPRLVDAVVDNYERFCKGKKTIVFNTTIEHCLKVHECFKSRGYNSMSLDSKCDEEHRKYVFKWLKETPDAILNNVGIATTGFDEPSIEAVIFNRKTKSLPLWLQCCGRGARLHTDKSHFIIIDMGGNIDDEGFGYWNEKHNWKEYFYNPSKPGEGAPPMKICPNKECQAMIYMSSTECKYCGHLMPREIVYTDMAVELKVLPDKPIQRNSAIALDKAVKELATRIATKKAIPLSDRKEIFAQSLTLLYDQARFELKPYIKKHLISVYVSD